ncbi:MAG: glycoside hydrolase family 13 protein [Lachnospiraceae bacterium]|nr:glycoside hydrolase family 13 protein [Lachnospiraceae bacterium]
MEFSAIYHDASKKYCYALENGKFVIRIKTKKEDIQSVILHSQDKYIAVELMDTRTQTLMQKYASDSWCDYYEAEMDIDVICLRYYFELIDFNGQKTYYGNHEFFDIEITDIDYMYDCPQKLREEEMFVMPQWAKNKVIYQIFPSRFASSQPIAEEKWYQAPIGAKDDLKGDLKGIIAHLDHLKELGVDVFYMTPIFYSHSTHKYDTIDYYKIDPSFGTEEDLKELVQKAHSLGIRVILDAVFNHTSPEFFAFADVLEHGEQSKYKDWYYIDSFPVKWEWGTKPNYKSFAYFGGMPKLNLQNEETADYFLEVARYWIETCDIDGWRLDVGDEISHKFWRKFRKVVKQIKPEALIIGEIWHRAEDFLDGEEWDTAMNYPFFYSVVDFIAKEKISASRFWANINALHGNLHKEVFTVLWNLIDSHDTARFLYRCGERSEKLKMAVALQMLLPGMPIIYYGDEYGMTGGMDPDCRRGMLWKEEYQNKEVYAWYRTLIQIRKQYPCVTEGQLVKTKIQDENGLLCLTKELKDEKIVICFHGADGEIELSEYAGKKNVLTGETFDGVLKGYDVVVLI